VTIRARAEVDAPPAHADLRVLSSDRRGRLRDPSLDACAPLLSGPAAFQYLGLARCATGYRVHSLRLTSDRNPSAYKRLPASGAGRGSARI
jgi:hypothetical protein